MQSLKSKKDIDKVFRKGKTLRSDFLFAKLLSNKEKKNRIAITVGLKYSKKAVQRNQFKRLIRQAVRDNENMLKRCFDVVFFTKDAKIEQVNFEKINQSVKEIFNNL